MFCSLLHLKMEGDGSFDACCGDQPRKDGLAERLKMESLRPALRATFPAARAFPGWFHPHGWLAFVEVGANRRNPTADEKAKNLHVSYFLFIEKSVNALGDLTGKLGVLRKSSLKFAGMRER
jgi:hypothetical protein